MAPYKDKLKQRASNKESQRRRRAGMTGEGMTASGMTVFPPNTILEQVDRDIHEAIGPLDIYSERRWSFLRGEGFVWDGDRCRAYRPARLNEVTDDGEVMAVVVPGDPCYRGSS